MLRTIHLSTATSRDGVWLGWEQSLQEKSHQSIAVSSSIIPPPAWGRGGTPQLAPLWPTKIEANLSGLFKGVGAFLQCIGGNTDPSTESRSHRAALALHSPPAAFCPMGILPNLEMGAVIAGGPLPGVPGRAFSTLHHFSPNKHIQRLPHSIHGAGKTALDREEQKARSFIVHSTECNAALQEIHSPAGVDYFKSVLRLTPSAL